MKLLIVAAVVLLLTSCSTSFVSNADADSDKPKVLYLLTDNADIPNLSVALLDEKCTHPDIVQFAQERTLDIATLKAGFDFHTDTKYQHDFCWIISSATYIDKLGEVRNEELVFMLFDDNSTAAIPVRLFKKILTIRSTIK